MQFKQFDRTGLVTDTNRQTDRHRATASKALKLSVAGVCVCVSINIIISVINITVDLGDSYDVGTVVVISPDVNGQYRNIIFDLASICDSLIQL